MLIGELKDVVHFYAAVKIAIGKGELDAQIGKLQAQKSAALKKRQERHDRAGGIADGLRI